MIAAHFGEWSLTTRFLLAALTGFVVSLACGAWLIAFFHRRRVIEDTTQPDHAGLNAIQSQKKNVPTMGGLMIIAGILAALLLWCDLRNDTVLLAALVIIVLGLAGFMDDYIKLCHKPSRGLNKKQKLAIQLALGAAVGWLLVKSGGGPGAATTVFFPFAGEGWNFGLWYVAWAAFLIAAASNAVNLTDGLDGLAGGCMAIAATAMTAAALIIFLAPEDQLKSNHVSIVQSIILCGAVTGAVAGFLWYNAHPAQIFMGDTGSLMLGGVLGYVALTTKLDFIVFVIGLPFFIDEATVALQVASFKLTGKRIFPITPIHHYFQVHRKWAEQKITERAWIIAVLAAVVGIILATCLGMRTAPP